MSWYLTILPTGDQPVVFDTNQLVGFLATLPELQQIGPVAFSGAVGQPWVSVILAKTRPTGGYASDGFHIPEVDIVELVCSYSGETSWYDTLAAKIAAFLGWTAIEEHEDRQL